MTNKFVDNYPNQAEIDNRTLRVLFDMYLDAILQAKDAMESRGIKSAEFPQMMNDLLKLVDKHAILR